jgi:hypothetical protein
VCELRLSCPDAATLVRKLMPWLKAVHWPGSVAVVKRDRGFDDVEARETPVTLPGPRRQPLVDRPARKFSHRSGR